MVYYCPPLNNAGIGNNDWGTRWGDSLGNVEQTRKQGFTSEAYRDTSVTMEFIDHNQVAHMDGQLQIDHDWNLDTEIHVHAHIVPMANAAGNVYWAFEYYLAPINGNIPAAASWTSGNTTTALVAADQYDHKVAEVFAFTPSGGTPSSIIMFRISRLATDVLDTYDTNKDHGTPASNLGVLYVDAHYQKDSPGTATEYA